jgi:hypothetical protein
MRLRTLALLTSLTLAALPVATLSLPAQTPIRQGRPGWTPVRIAKWALLGVAGGFAGYALAHSTRAEDAYADLRGLCNREPDRCQLDGGRYPDPEAERLYRTATRDDRQAQVGIFGGQVALLGSAALFIYDLRNGRGPVNIPYPSSAYTAARRSPGYVVGLRLSF